MHISRSLHKKRYRIATWLVSTLLFFVLYHEILSAVYPQHFSSYTTTVWKGFVHQTIFPNRKAWHGLCEQNGALTVQDFFQKFSSDSSLQSYYHNFHWPSARIIVAKESFFAHVAYTPLRRMESYTAFPWSSRPVLLQVGEYFITDRENPWDESSGWLIRSWCCNAVSVIPYASQSSSDDEPLSLYFPPSAPVAPIIQPPKTENIAPILKSPGQQQIFPPLLRMATFENPPHVIYRREPPQDTCAFHPEIPIPECFPPTIPEKDRVVCGKDGKPMRIPVCEDIPPATLTPERTAILTPEPSTWALFGTGIILAILFHRKIKRG